MKKENKLNTVILPKLPKTTNLLINLYGSDVANKKQLFIKRNDASAIASAISDDLKSWKKEEFEIHFTTDNGKLDGIPSIAFNPWITCKNESCLKLCYGTKGKYLSFFKFFYMTENTILYNLYPDAFIKKFSAFLNLYQPRFFRHFENGDLINADNVKAFNDLAKEHPETNFLMMTKKVRYVNEYLKEKDGSYSKNLVIRFSKSDLKECQINKSNPFNMLETEIVEKKASVKENQVRCPGSSFGCLRCLKCWKCKKTVEFEKHE